MGEASEFQKICGEQTSALDIVFIHGLTGDAVGTWKSGSDEYWPKWLCEKYAGVSVHALNYPSSVFGKWAKKEMNLHERAHNMLEQLAANGIGKRPIVFVCHSLGGLLAKEMLRTSRESAEDGWHKIGESARLVAFLATPHTGASLATVIKLAFPRLSSTHLSLLTNDSGYLTSLNQSYRDIAIAGNITTVSYYEKYKTKDIALVVSPESADPGVGRARPIAVDADHVSICKPANREALIFTSLCRHVEDVLRGCSRLFDVDDYSKASPSDRRDLLQKLIDAGREHEYQYANGLQNKFAQRYYKLGLFTGAKADADAILASVEQRFVVHVYQAKICKGASDDDIKDALQSKVIDTLCADENFKAIQSPAAVLQALYFLTEQCYIRWDPE
jgi:hypothetical protein